MFKRLERVLNLSPCNCYSNIQVIKHNGIKYLGVYEYSDVFRGVEISEQLYKAIEKELAFKEYLEIKGEDDYV